MANAVTYSKRQRHIKKPFSDFTFREARKVKRVKYLNLRKSTTNEKALALAQKP